MQVGDLSCDWLYIPCRSRNGAVRLSTENRTRKLSQHTEPTLAFKLRSLESAASVTTTAT